MIPFPKQLRTSGTLDEPGVLNGFSTVIIPAPGGGSYSTAERSILRDYVLNGGRLVFTADDEDIAADAKPEINSILAEIGSTLSLGVANPSEGEIKGQVMPSSISTTSGEFCVYDGAEINMDVASGDEAIAVFDDTGKPVMACGRLSP